MRGLINSAPVIVPLNQKCRTALREMTLACANSLLVVDAQDEIVGIVTRQDVIRHLNKDRAGLPLDMPVWGIMTSPVECAHFDSLGADVRYLFFELNLKHFPVVRGHGPPSVRNLVGTLTVDAIGQGWLKSRRLDEGAQDEDYRRL